MLHIIDRLAEWPVGFSPEPFTASPDAGVRREAVKLMLRRDDMREAAIVRGLEDQDERTVGIALAAALKRCPLPAVPILMRRVESGTLSAELRARAIRALAASGSHDAMRWIARRSVKKHWLLGTPVLCEKSPQLISSIAGLAAHWSAAPEAVEVLALVARSKDVDLKTAARSGAT
jgi:Arc/MetJ family transcription regulator